MSKHRNKSKVNESTDEAGSNSSSNRRLELPLIEQKIRDYAASYGINAEELRRLILEYVVADERLVREAVKSILGTDAEDTTSG
jgi:hypothetical protein